MEKEFEKLKGTGSKVFHDIPDGYFDELSSAIIQKIDEGKKAKSYYRNGLSIAAFIISVLTVGGYLLFHQFESTDNEIVILANNHIENPDSLRKLNNPAKMIHVNDTVLPVNNKKLYLENDTILFSKISNEDILQYLIEMEEFEF